MTRVQTGRQRSEAKRQIVILNPSICYYCKSTGLTEADKFCPNCAFPQRGNQVMMKRFIWNINNKHILLANQKKAVSKARNILFGLAILFFLLSIIFSGIIAFHLTGLITGIMIAGIYLALGFWSRKHPFPAILTGFFLYVTLIVINAIVDPSTIVDGFFVKAFVIAGFVYGYKGVKDSALLQKELESIKKAKDLKVSDEVPEMSN